MFDGFQMQYPLRQGKDKMEDTGLGINKIKRLTNLPLLDLIINKLLHSLTLVRYYKSKDEGAWISLRGLDILPQRGILLMVDVLFRSLDNAVARFTCGLAGMFVRRR